jgi:FtsP/CotA-like multicopper oxidase with cupredoxin domain
MNERGANVQPVPAQPMRRDVLRVLGGLPLLSIGAGLGCLGGCARLPVSLPASAAPHTIRASPSTQSLGAQFAQPTAIWAYDGTSPGTVLRYRQGETAEIEVVNALPAPTTVHWHGLRVPNAMDGVPFVTQPPIAPGERFRYRFALEDAGTFWYHPHFRSHEQVTRGLYGAFIVDEDRPPQVDGDWIWVLADWLVADDGTIRTDFEDPRDMSHAGRIGNIVTLNGRMAMHRGADPAPLRLPAGRRIRLRLINAASARIFVLGFSGFTPTVIAFDGQPVEPHPAPRDTVILGPAMRADLIVDVPSGRFGIRDRTDPRREYYLREFIGEGDARPRAAFTGLPPNPLPEPNLERAERHEIVLEGGARGRLRSARVGNKVVPIEAMVREHGMAWAMNGVAANDHVHDPFVSLERGASCIVSIVNRTEWPHPMHLHGHAFRVLAVNGQATRYREWRDTVIVNANGSVEIAFVADNPGEWMFHCHILQHQQGGMMGSIRVRGG